MTSQLVSQMLTAATPSMANHLWQSTVFTAVVWLLALALRENHARTRYWLWMTASAKFLIPFSLLIAAGGYLRPTTSVTMATPVVSAVMEQMTQPFSQSLSPNESASTVVALPVVTHNSVLLPMILLSVWTCGSLIVAFSWWRRWRTIRAAVREASYMTMVADVPVLSSRSLLEPGAFGISRPVLLLPEGIAARLTEAQLSAILAHEMCHVRRRDNLTAAVHMVVEAAFWFHPATWWISTRLVEERERACDEAVLRAGSEALVYAEGILNVCKFYVESPLECVAGVTGADLKQRIVRIMTGQVERKLDFSRKVLLSVAGLLTVAAPVVFGIVHAAVSYAQSPAQSTAQDISGTWQGTLQVPNGRSQRIVNKITKEDTGELKVLYYSIDQSGRGMTATGASFVDGAFKYSIVGIAGSYYEGKMSADGKAITGNWTQGTTSLPLNLERVTADAAWPIPESPKPMAADANPGFEVATIKPSQPGQRGVGFLLRGDRIVTINTTLMALIGIAYNVQEKQVIGGPDWMGKDKFDIEGKPDTPGTPSLEQSRVMVRKLLADRFQLKFHHDKKELSAYVLNVTKGGPKLTQETGDPKGGPRFRFQGLGVLSVRNATMGDFASTMQERVLDRPVVDQTSLPGKWDFMLNWTPDDSQFTQARAANSVLPPTNDNPNAPPDLFTAIQEQLGLKLESTKAPVDVIVIDHVERPSPN